MTTAAPTAYPSIKSSPYRTAGEQAPPLDSKPKEPVKGFTPEQIAELEAEFGFEEDGAIAHVRAETFSLIFRRPKEVEFLRFKAVTSKEDNPARPEAQAQMAFTCCVGVWDKPTKRGVASTVLFTANGPEAVKVAFRALKSRLPGVADQDAVTKLFRRMLTGEAEEAGKD